MENPDVFDQISDNRRIFGHNLEIRDLKRISYQILITRPTRGFPDIEASGLSFLRLLRPGGRIIRIFPHFSTLFLLFLAFVQNRGKTKHVICMLLKKILWHCTKTNAMLDNIFSGTGISSVLFNIMKFRIFRQKSSPKGQLAIYALCD